MDTYFNNAQQKKIVGVVDCKLEDDKQDSWGGSCRRLVHASARQQFVVLTLLVDAEAVPDNVAAGRDKRQKQHAVGGS